MQLSQVDWQWVGACVAQEPTAVLMNEGRCHLSCLRSRDWIAWWSFEKKIWDCKHSCYCLLAVASKQRAGTVGVFKVAERACCVSWSCYLWHWVFQILLGPSCSYIS